MSFLKKIVNKSVVNVPRETEILYTSRKQNRVIEGVELPEDWKTLNQNEIRNQARNAILELSRSSNSDLKAKELGFKNAEHLMQLCFDYILK